MEIGEVSEYVLKFNQLKNINNPTELQNINKTSALLICKNVLNCSEVDSNEIFYLWVKKLLNAYGIVNFTWTEWTQLTDIFKTIIKQTVAATSEPLHDILEKLRKHLFHCIDFLNVLHPLIPQLENCINVKALHFFLDALQEFFVVYNNCQDKQFYENIRSYHALLNKIINENLCQINALDYRVRSTIIFEVLNYITTVGEHVLIFDLKLAIDTWKTIVKLLIHFCKQFHSEPEFNIEDTTQLSRRPLQILLNEVNRRYNAVYKGYSNFNQEQFVKYLRLIKLFLCLVLKIAELLKNDTFPASQELFESLCITLRDIPNCNNTEDQNLIDINIRRYGREILEHVYQNRDIHQLVLQNVNLYYVTREFLHVSIVSGDSRFISEYLEVYTKIFEKIAQSPEVFISSVTYDEFREYYAALTVLSATSKFKKYLMENVLHQNFVLAHVSTEVLLKVLRITSAKGAHSEILKDFLFWRHCNDLFSLYSNNERKLHIKLLLMRSCSLCNGTEYIDMDLSKRNYHFLLSVGLKTIFKSDVLDSYCTLLCNKILKIIEQFNEEFYALITFIDLLTTTETPPDKNFLNALMNFIFTIQPNLPYSNFRLLFPAILKMVTTFLKLNTNENAVNDNSFINDVLNIISEKERELQQEDISLAHIAIINFRMELKKRNELQFAELPKIFKNHKNQNLLVSILLNENYTDSISSNTLGSKIFGSENLKLFNNRFITCCCNKKETFKRPRIDDDRNNNDVKSLLEVVSKKVDEIVCLRNQLDNTDVVTLRSILNNLQKCIL